MTPLAAALAAGFSFTCFHPGQSTSVRVSVQGEEVVAEFVHLRGAGQIPLGDDVSAADLSALQEKARLAESLGPRWTFRWPLASCGRDGDGRLDCTRGAAWQAVGGVEVKPFSLWTTRVAESDVHGSWESVKVKLYLLTKLEGAAREPVFSFSFPSSACTFDAP